MKGSARLLVALALLAALGASAFVLAGDAAAPASSAESAPPSMSAAAPKSAPRRRVEDASEPAQSPVADESDDLDPPRAAGRVLRILDVGGAPVRDARVYRADGARLSTDRHGEVGFSADGPPPKVTYDDGAERKSVDLTGPLTEVRIGRVPRLGVEFIDASTGAPIRVGKARARRENGEWAPVSEGTASTQLFPSAIGWATAEVDVEPPTSFGAFDPYVWSGPVATRAKEVVVRVPVFPERIVSLLLVDEEGKPVEGAKVERLVTNLWGHQRALEVTKRPAVSDEKGLLRIVGVPGVPFCKIHFDVTKPVAEDRSFELAASVQDLRLDEPTPAEPPRVVMKRRKYERTYSSSGGGGSGCGMPKFDGERAPIVVRCIHRDGLPAARVRVSVGDRTGDTESDGSIRFGNAQVGTHDVSAAAHGFLPTIVRVDVGAVAEVVVRETAPRTVHVTVVDEAGRPLPGACVTSEAVRVVGPSGEPRYVGCSVAQLAGDVELATPTTDRDGAVTLEVPAGVVEYRVVLGGAKEQVESSADFVRVVVHPPKD